MSKCSEFMICDWVQDHTRFPMQVRVVGEDYLYADFEGNEGDMWEFDDKTDPPYPIPLTEEILQKNGFITDTGRQRIETFVSFTENHNNITNTITLRHCGMYVHELQHALRLAGLQEIADNFKT